MSSRYGFSCFGLSLLAALAGCSPDRIDAPNARHPAAPATDISELSGTDASLYDQSVAYPTDYLLNEVGAYQGDDFVVPAGETWTVTQVALSGVLGMQTLPFAIRANNAGVPGSVIQSFNLAPTSIVLNHCDCYGYYNGFMFLYDYLFALSTPLTLTPGTYWLTVGPVDPGVSFTWMHHEHIGLDGADSNDGSTWRTPSNEYAFAVFGSRRVPQTITFPAITPNPAMVASGATLGASASSQLAVSYTSLTADVCTLAGSTVSYRKVGRCTVAADQAGNTTYNPATRATQSVNVDYGSDGFLDPVENGSVLNVAKAGQTIPLRWRLTDASGAPITTLTSVKITATDLNCALGATGDAVAEQAAGGSGLQNLGSGDYQYNWKSPAAYAKSCKTLQLDLGEGSGPRTARFAFTK